MTRIDILTYQAGRSLDIDFVCLDSAGAAIDLTGATVRWSIGRIGGCQSACDRYLTLSSDDSTQIDITSAVAGELTVSIAAGAFKRAGEFTHELEVVLATGESITQFQGRFRSHGSMFAEDTLCGWDGGWHHGCGC